MNEPTMTVHNGSSPPPIDGKPFAEDGRLLAERVREALWQAQAQQLRGQEWFAFAADGHLLTDVQGVIEEANYAAAALLNARREHLLDKPLGLFLTAESLPMFYKRLRRLAASESVEQWEARVCRPPGPRRELMLISAAYPDEQGRGVKLRWLLRDVTELREAQRQALQAERLAAIGQMAAGLGHESRNALQRSQACLALLNLRLQDRPECLELLGRMETAQDDLRRLFEDVRAYALAPRLQRRCCNLRESWREAWENLAGLPQWSSAELREDIDNVDLFCEADPFYLRQVFRNLLENALSSGASPVRIVLRCRPVAEGRSKSLCIRLSDNGPGIPAEAQQRLFEPVFHHQEARHRTWACYLQTHYRSARRAH